MGRSWFSRARAGLSAGLVAVVVLLGTGGSTLAQVGDTVTVSTPYPTVEALPGATVKLALEVASPRVETVDLALDGLPSEWGATIRGGGFVIHSITPTPGAPAKADLELVIPADATPGDYPLTVTGRGRGGSAASTLITMDVVEQVNSGINLTADFPSLSGDPGSPFSYNLTIENNTPEDQSFTFDPAGPQGWTVTASPTAQANAQTVSIEAGSTTGVKVVATPPETAAEGSYPIDVVVTAANGATGRIALDAQVTGTPKLEMATTDQRLDASGRSNAEHRIPLLLSNSGTASLDSVKLVATAPTDWEVTFDPPETGAIKAGEVVQATAIVKPAPDAVAGDYAVTLRSSAGSQSSTLDMRYTVEGSRLLGLVAILVIAAAFAVLAGVFVRFGRR